MAEDVNYGDPDTTWRAQEYLAREIDDKTGRIKRKIGLPDEHKRQAQYRDGYEKTFGHP